MDMDCVSDIELELKRVAHELYKNPRISNLSIHADTLMGTSVTYTSLGDMTSPICKANKAREIQNAIQNSQRPAISCTEVAPACTRDIPGSLQQWIGADK